MNKTRFIFSIIIQIPGFIRILFIEVLQILDKIILRLTFPGIAFFPIILSLQSIYLLFEAFHVFQNLFVQFLRLEFLVCGVRQTLPTQLIGRYYYLTEVILQFFGGVESCKREIITLCIFQEHRLFELGWKDPPEGNSPGFFC
jgi:hypothetical protein